MHQSPDDVVEVDLDLKVGVLSDALAALMADHTAMQQLYRLAEYHGRLPRDSLIAQEVVAEVIEDLLTADIARDPQLAISKQVARLVRRRGVAHRKAGTARGRRRKKTVLLITLDDAPASALAIEPPAYGEFETEPIDAVEVLRRVHEYARDDWPVQQLLAAGMDGIRHRRSVLAAGLSEWAYRMAGERLRHYVMVARAALALADAPDVEDVTRALLPATGMLDREPMKRTLRRPCRRVDDPARSTETA